MGIVTLSLYLPKQKKLMLPCCRRSAWINERFQKACVKNQCPLHAIDGCRTQRKTKNTCLLWKMTLPLIVLVFSGSLPLFVFFYWRLCWTFIFTKDYTLCIPIRCTGRGADAENTYMLGTPTVTFWELHHAHYTLMYSGKVGSAGAIISALLLIKSSQ